MNDAFTPRTRPASGTAAAAASAGRPISRRTALGLAAGVSLAATGALAAPAQAVPARAATRAAASTAARVGVPHLGVYRWGAPDAPAKVDAYADWIGEPDVWALDFMATDTWDNIMNPTWELPVWGKWVGARAGRNLVLSVPMLPGPWDLSGPTTGTGAGQAVSLAAGAAGDYDGYFRTLGESLVAAGLGSAWLRIGWEFNGGWYAWRASSDTAHWATFFQAVVGSMRGVAGSDFRFIWNPTIGYQQVPADQLYPGDSYVDFIGLDVYDQSWAANTYPWPAGSTAAQIAAAQQTAWTNDIHGGDHGLAYWKTYADSHGKYLVVPEWGVCDRGDTHGGLDNPAFVQNMHDFLVGANVPYASYFDVNASDGAHQLSPGVDPNGNPVTTEFPNSAAKYLELFSGTGA
ncbi:glycosyl hydrolase [Streptomyces sp. NBC_00370]|uniref:glycosyl hydrolase n=1 Tax=Streptomyces sp. NBC_00370 TaxID=2975728 RepID=UPI002E259C93